MHPLVRDLYKRCLIVGKHYPQGLAHVREKAKQYMFANKNIIDEVELKRCVGKGRYYVRELQAVTKIRKYRAIKKNYGPSETEE